MRRLITLKFFLALSFVAMAAATPLAGANLNAGTGDWEWSNPDPQGNTVSSIDFADADTGWAVGTGGTVLKTVDGGASWNFVTPPSSCLPVTTSDCYFSGVDFVDANTGWVVGGYAGWYGIVWKTVDGGASWTSQTTPAIPGTNPPARKGLNSVSFFNASIGVALADGYAYYTNNGGASWLASTGLNTGLSYDSVQMVTGTTGFIVGEGGSIYKTTNGGASWVAKTSNTASNLTGVYFVDADRGYAVGNCFDPVPADGWNCPGGTQSSGRILRTTNGGETWQVNTGVAINGTLEAVTISPDNNRLVAVGNSGALFQRNSAANWDDPMDTVATNLTGVSSDTNSPLMTVKFASGTVAYAAGASGAISKTVDGGNAWSLMAGGDAMSILTSSFVSDQMGWMAGHDGLIIRTVDRGDSWAPDSAGIPADMDVKGLHMLSSSSGFAAGTQGATVIPDFDGDGVIYRYNGSTWSAMTVPADIGPVQSVHMADGTNGRAVGQNGLSLKTVDGGSNWIHDNAGIPATSQLNSVEMTSVTDGWAVGQNTLCGPSPAPPCKGAIYRYNSGTSAWVETVMPDLSFFGSIDMIDANTGYAVGSSGKIYKTTNGGVGWTAKTFSNKVLTSVSFMDTMTGFASGGDLYGSIIIKTADGGQNWTSESIGTSIGLNTISTVASVDRPYVAFAGGSNGIILQNIAARFPRPYHFTWYDDNGGDNWVLMANPASRTTPLSFSLSIGGTPMSLPNGGSVAPGSNITPKYSGLVDGPVTATSLTGEPGIVSQRILWPKGGNSLEEVLGTDATKLSSHFYWTWYDESAGSGFKNWVLVANPGQATVYYRIKLDGGLLQRGSIAPQENVTPRFPGVIGGPLEVEGCTVAFTTDPNVPCAPESVADVMASQRVLSNNDMAFNEETGIRVEDLSNHYLWTWYDDVEGRNWILVANPDPDNPVTYTIKIAGQNVPDYTDRPLAGGATETPKLMISGGPVEVTTTPTGTGDGKVLASQRVIWGPSFEETPGYAFDALRPNYHWTWYDQSAAGITNWVLVANPSSTEAVDYQVLIAGQLKAQGTLQPGTSATPSGLGGGAGPVEVRAILQGGIWANWASDEQQRRNVMVSQRVIWKGYFNEVLGTVLE